MEVLFSGSLWVTFSIVTIHKPHSRPQKQYFLLNTININLSPEPARSKDTQHQHGEYFQLFFKGMAIEINREQMTGQWFLFLLAFCLFSIISTCNYWRKVSSKRVWKWKMEQKTDYAAHRVANQLGNSRRPWPAVFDPVKLSSEAANMNCIVYINGALE